MAIPLFKLLQFDSMLKLSRNCGEIPVKVWQNISNNRKVTTKTQLGLEQGATHVSGLPASLTAAAAKERLWVGTSRPLAALAALYTNELHLACVKP